MSTLGEPTSLEARFVRIESEVDTIGKNVSEIKETLSELSKPKPTNWIGIVTVIMSIVVPTSALLGMFVSLRLNPIEERVRSQAQSSDKFEAGLTKDLQWMFENQGLHRQHVEKLIDRLWERTFNGDPPKFADKPKQ